MKARLGCLAVAAVALFGCSAGGEAGVGELTAVSGSASPQSPGDEEACELYADATRYDDDEAVLELLDRAAFAAESDQLFDAIDDLLLVLEGEVDEDPDAASSVVASMCGLT